MWNSNKSNLTQQGWRTAMYWHLFDRRLIRLSKLSERIWLLSSSLMTNKWTNSCYIEVKRERWCLSSTLSSSYLWFVQFLLHLVNFISLSVAKRSASAVKRYWRVERWSKCDICWRGKYVFRKKQMLCLLFDASTKRHEVEEERESLDWTNIDLFQIRMLNSLTLPLFDE